MPNEKSPKKKQPLSDKETLRFMGLGMQVAGTMIFGLLIGYLLDNYFNTGSTFLLIFGMVAIVAALYQIIKPFLKK